jgi:hypothetical protein
MDQNNWMLQNSADSGLASVVIYPQLPLNYIQSVRLIHALAESSFEIGIPPEDQAKFARLVEVFGFAYRTDTEHCHPLTGLEISHQEPRSSVGSLARPLIFPHAILDRCHSLWNAQRPIKYSFAGLITGERRKVLQAWVDQTAPGTKTLGGLPHAVKLPKLLIKFLRRLGYQPVISASVTKVAIGELLLWSSTRGRAYPDKAWDEDYFQLLADSAFVLCPSGDYVWTYRFFEAVMCGAIPIVEQSCDAYAGFHYYSMQTPPTSLIRSEEQVLENFQLCRARLTVPRDQLDAEIVALLNLARPKLQI